VEPRGWTLPHFEPGQWATLGLPDPEGEGRFLKRVYSIASEPGQPHLEFYIQLVKEGEFTTRLWHLHPGDRLWLAPNIAGFFTLEPVPPGADLALIATGTGLAPFVSMLRHARRTRSRPWRSCVIAHGARSAAELGYRAELSTAGDGLVYLPLVTREPPDSDWTGLRGRVQALLEGDAWGQAVGAPLDPATWHVFLCGNPEMIDDLDARLKALGFTHHRRTQPGNLHFERYW
jgi:ferredoxin--NADP+ reductase